MLQFQLLPDLNHTQPLKVTVIDTAETLFTGEVTSISSFNYKGAFDILSLHTNFISIIRDRLILRTANGSTREFSFPQAIMHCYKNGVKIYLGF